MATIITPTADEAFYGAAITPDSLVAALKRQVAEIPAEGEIGLFGDPITADDIALALERVANVAAGCAARIRAELSRGE